MQVVHCVNVGEYPEWVSGAARETADIAFGENEDALVIFCRRDDGEVQAIPEGWLDAEVIEALMKWAAGRK